MKKVVSTQQTVESSAFFDAAGIKYEEAYGHAEGLHQSLRTFLARLSVDGPVLDCGSGTGKPVAAAIAATGRPLHAIDFSPRMVDLTRAAVPSATVTHVNMLDYAPPAQFAGIVAMLSLFEFTRVQLESVAARWASWLVPGGLLLLGVFAAEDCRTTPDMFDPDGKCANGIPFFFMHHETSMNLFTKSGWRGICEDEGLVVETTQESLFRVPPNAGSEDEPYYFVFARKPLAT